MKSLIKIIFLLVVPVACYSQHFSISQYRSELNIKLEIIEEKRLEKGIQTLNEAVIIESEAIALMELMDDEEIMMGESKTFLKMLKKFMSASHTYNEGHFIIYSVYFENSALFKTEMKKMNHYASGMNKAKYYQSRGKKTLSKAKNMREVLHEADKPEWIQYKMHEALELEKYAIRDIGRALQIYQDFPAEYNYDWDNDISDEELAKFYKNPLIKMPAEDVFKRLPKEEKKVPEGGIIDFRVQIAAHTVQINDEYIRSFYTGKDSVSEVQEGAWFKYQIGSFDNFNSADSLRIDCRVPRSFVVSYQGDKKISIKKALAILQENQ